MDSSDAIYLGTGARDGDRARTTGDAVRRLQARGVAIRRVSHLYETAPVDLPGDRTLFNAALEVVTALPPPELLEICLQVERDLGRRRVPGPGPDTGPRPIDIDILLWGDRIVTTDPLVIPHPRMHLRRFVLEPLAEIAPGAVHPLLGIEVRELLARCGDRGEVRRIGPL